MTTDYQLFYDLFQSIPTYGFGSTTDLETARIRFIQNAKKLTESLEYKEFAAQAIKKADEIEYEVTLAKTAKDEDVRMKSFEKASNELALCIESLLWRMHERESFTKPKKY